MIKMGKNWTQRKERERESQSLTALVAFFVRLFAILPSHFQIFILVLCILCHVITFNASLVIVYAL